MAPEPFQPSTIPRHILGVYNGMAILAGMQLDVFTPLKDGPLSCQQIASALGVAPVRLDPLLYALVQAELLTFEGGRFANTPEADRFLVRGRPAYMGSAHELYSDLWTSTLGTARSIHTDAPQTKHDFAAMTDAELGAFFRGLHAGALATGRQLAASEGFTGARSLLDVGGGSGGVAIGACEARPGLTATIVELPRISSIARSFVAEAGLDARIAVLEADLIQAPPAGLHEVGVLRNLLQVLSAEQCRRVVHHVGAAIAPGGVIYIVGHVLEDSRLAPPHAVAMNLVFLNVYDAGASHTEAEHRVWLAEAGFADVEVRYGAGPGNASIIVARKAG